MDVFRKSLRVGAAVILLGLGLGSIGRAYTVEVTASTAPAGTENAFLQATQQQFNVQITTNPFFQNTYNMTLYGPNPNYNPPPTNIQLLNSLVTVDSYTYVYGWGDGETKERFTDLQYMNNFAVDCINISTSTFFVVGSTTIYDTAISSTTCLEAVTTIQNYIYQQSFPVITTGYWLQ